MSKRRVPPRASIVIPAYKSDSTIAACLEALRSQTIQDFETIVVNSFQDETEAIVRGGFPEVIFVQSSKRLLPHAARNRGVERAHGDLLVFTDPDCVPARTWLERLVAAIESGHTVVQGSMGLGKRSGWLERAIHVCKWHALLPGLPSGPLRQVATGNACYSRSVWQEVGPFEGDLFCGDALLSWRARDAGNTLWFEPLAVVEQIHAGNLVRYLRERFSRGRDYGLARADYERFSRPRAVLRSAALPVLLAVVLARQASASVRAGWLRTYLMTLPIGGAGLAAWSLGEASGYAANAMRGEAAA